MGQISGIVFVYLFEQLNNSFKSPAVPMLLIVAVTVLELPFVLRIKESGLNQQH